MKITNDIYGYIKVAGRTAILSSFEISAKIKLALTRLKTQRVKITATKLAQNLKIALKTRPNSS